MAAQAGWRHSDLMLPRRVFTCWPKNPLNQSLKLLLGRVVWVEPLVKAAVASPVWPPSVDGTVSQTRLTAPNHAQRLGIGMAVEDEPDVATAAFWTHGRLAQLKRRIWLDARYRAA
jgi:hypothetical protein